jgi:ABC-type multidrug transport system fused ATPase/permease subunit
VAIACVLVIAALWGGGLGLMLPGSKILLSTEGLHGWAWNSMASDRLGATIVQRQVPPEKVEDYEVSVVLDLVNLDPCGPAAKAGLRKTDWLVGLAAEGKRQWVRGDYLAKRLAKEQTGRTATVLAYRSSTKAVQAVPVTLGELRMASKVLGEVATALPEPADYPGRFVMFLGLALVGVVVGSIRALFQFIQEYLVGTAIWRAIMDLRMDNYQVVLRLPTTFFSEKGVSDATSRFVQDTNELARGLNTLLGKTMVEPAKAVGAFTLAMLASWELTLLMTVAAPAVYFIIRRFGKKMHRASRKALEGWSGLLAVLNETLQGIRVVKAYTMEGAERKRFFRVSRSILVQQNRMERLDAATGPTVEMLGVVAGTAAAVIAGWMVFNYHMDRDLFLTWMVAGFALFDPARKLAKVSMRFESADAAATRIFELQDSPQEVVVTDAPALGRHGRSIEFRNVSFRYPGAGFDALKDINLTVKAGQTVAIVGPNGCGKTTLLSLIPRLIDPAAGAVLIDGQDISQVSLRSLRRQIGLVTQDTVIFHATVAENISYGLRRPKREAVNAAAKKAFVDEFVGEMPNGYDTVVGEYGATLSGGQKQRIAIARAILRDPAILIFDEAMSQVDAHSEKRIHEAMHEFVHGRTALMIAHRFQTVMEADGIVVMDEGRIIDHGPHAQLLERCGLYRHLYETQLTHSAAAGA